MLSKKIPRHLRAFMHRHIFAMRRSEIAAYIAQLLELFYTDDDFNIY